MSKISGKDTKPEILLRKYLFSRGIRFRKNDRRYPGNPDVVLPKYQTVIFIHGCFWHGHKGCKASKLPTTNIKFWKEKIQSNIDRDKAHCKSLRAMDWKVIVIWQCEIKSREKRDKRFDKLISQIHIN